MEREQVEREAKLEARVAELEGEIERLRRDRHEWKRQHAMMCRSYRDALSDLDEAAVEASCPSRQAGR